SRSGFRGADDEQPLAKHESSVSFRPWQKVLELHGGAAHVGALVDRRRHGARRETRRRDGTAAGHPSTWWNAATASRFDARDDRDVMLRLLAPSGPVAEIRRTT